MEISYDMGLFYTNLAYARPQPISASYANSLVY